LDQKVSTEIGAGVAADIFMKNTIGNPDENIATQEFNRSSSGPYRDLGFSGLVSARVNYQFSSRYNVYVVPSYRTALTPFTNSIIVSSRPNSFGIGTGFQYRF
jgi:outer membrane scaffolding protein for murein synthesis (MipA/OmpV family)